MTRADEVVLFERRQLRWLPFAIGAIFAVILLGLLPNALISSEVECLRVGGADRCTVDAWLGTNGSHIEIPRHELSDLRVEQISSGRRGSRPRCTLHLVRGGEEIPALRRGDCDRLREVRSDLRGWMEGGGPDTVRERVSPGREALILPATALVGLLIGLALLRSIRVRVLDRPRRLEVSTWTLGGRREDSYEVSRVRAIRVDEVTASDFAGRTSTRIQVGARVGDDLVVLGDFVTRMDALDLATPIEKALGLHGR